MMEAKHLIALEKWTLALAALVVAFALLALSGRVAFGVTVGAALMALNAWALRRIGARAFKTFKKPGAAVLLFNLKMVVLVAVVFLILRFLPVDPMGFIIGISIFPVAILAVAIKHAMTASEESHG